MVEKLWSQTESKGLTKAFLLLLRDLSLPSFLPSRILPLFKYHRDFRVLLKCYQRELYWHRQLAKTEQWIYKDDLTGLYNYRYLQIALKNEISRHLRFGQEFSVLFIDLDNFKSVNDRFGHYEGSSILEDLATVLASSVREIDIVVRYGGDEFVVLLIGTDSIQALEIADRIRRKIASTPFSLQQTAKKISLTVSIGIANYPHQSHSSEELLRLADKMMYQSKHQGKNKVTAFGEDHNSPQTPHDFL